MLRRDLFANAARIQPTGEPLDWMENQFPAKWKLNNKEVTFNWIDKLNHSYEHYSAHGYH
jgi:hypothetical protein